MKTAVVMQRNFLGHTIRQDSQTGFFNLNDLHAAYEANTAKPNKNIYEFLRTKQTQEFAETIRESILEHQSVIPDKSTELVLPLVDSIQVIYTKRGKHGGTWVHPYLFLDFAMWLSPRFKLWAMQVIEDKLIELRNEAGDKFKEMTQAMKVAGIVSPREYASEISMINKIVFGSATRGQRNTANHEQLDLLNKLQKYNAHLIEKGYTQSLRQKECANFLKFYEFIKK
jgi:hypothetical protein